jgi:WD40 repeat protein
MNVLEGKEVGERQVKGGVSALAWHPDGKLLAVVASDQLQIWDVAKGKKMRSWRLGADAHPSLGMPPKPGEPFVDRSIFLGSWTMSLHWGPTGQKLALVDSDGKVQVWDAGTDKPGQAIVAHEGGVHCAAWNPDGRRLASVGGDGLIKIWDTTTRKKVFALSIRKPGNFPITASYALTWTDDGKHISVVSGDGEIQTLDVASSVVTDGPKLVHRESQGGIMFTAPPLRRFVWSPGAKLLASVQSGGVVKTWDAATGQEGSSISTPGAGFSPLMAGMCCPAWDGSGRRLALGGSDGTVQALPIGPGKRAVRRPPIPNALAWAGDSKHLLGTPVWSLATDESFQAAQQQMGETPCAGKPRPRNGHH